MRWTVSVCSLVLTAALVGASAAAQPATAKRQSGSPPLSRIHQIYVPADAPEQWPAGDWAPLGRKDLLELLAPSEESSPAAAALERAVYRARYSGGSFVGGTLEAVSRLRGDRPHVVDLGKPTPALSRLRWADRAAIWGLADDGRSLLRVEKDRAELSGRWSLAGRRVFGTDEFDVVLPPATVSRLELELPETRELSVDRGLISDISESARPGWKTWTIDMGGRTWCRLQVRPAGAPASRQPRGLQVTQTATYTFGDTEIRAQSDVTVQSVSGAFESLEFIVPRSMTFSSVTVGNETVLTTSRTQDDGRSLLVVDVSDVVLARGTRIRLRGQMPLQPGNSQGLPRLGLRGSRWLQVRRQVRVISPLQLKDIEATGSRLVNSSMGLDSGAALEFDDAAPPSRIRVTVDTPQPELSATVLARADWQRSDPRLRTEMTITAQTGSTYSLEFDVPAEWQVTRVDSGSAMPVAQWRTSRDADRGRNRLIVELRNALSPQAPVRLTVLARPQAAVLRDRQIIDTPVVMPLVTERDVAVVITPPSGVLLEPELQSAYQTIDIADLVVDRPELGEEFTDVASRDVLVLQAKDPGDDQRLEVRRNDASAPAPTGPNGSHHQPADDATENPDVALTGGEPFHGALELTSRVAVEDGGLCRNRAVLHLPPVAAPRSLRVRIPDPARLLGADSSLPLQVTGREVVVSLAPGAEPAEVTLRYESPLKVSLLSGQAAIPLPQWDGEATRIGWQLELPERLRVLDSTDGATAMVPATLDWKQRLLGPLGRGPGEGLFWPLDAAVWIPSADVPSEASLPVDDLQRLYRCVPAAGESLTLGFWNVEVSRRLGWVALIIGLLLTSWPFQPQRLLLPGWSLAVVLIGAAAVLLAPEMLAFSWGGLTIGAAIGALLPDRWRCPRWRAVSRKTQPDTRILLSLSASTRVLLVGILLAPATSHGWQPADSGSAPKSEEAEDPPLAVLIPLDVDAESATELPAYVYVERAAAQQAFGRHFTSSPRYLLRSAVYDVDGLETERPGISARYNVVLLQPDQQTRIVLPLAGVQFPDASLCRVDGEPVPLLPHRGGDGVVIVVPADEPTQNSTADDDTTGDDEAQANDANANDAKVVQVELVCQPRPSTGLAGPRLDIRIPPIIDSRATFGTGGEETPVLRTVHAGAVTRPRGQARWRVALGARGHLTAQLSREDEAHIQRWQSPVEAVSVVEVHPLRLRIDSRLSFQTQPQWARLDGHTLKLQLPPASIVRNVRAAGLSQSRVEPDGGSGVLLNLTFDGETPAERDIEISFDLPARRLEDGSGVELPAMPFLVDAEVSDFPLHRVAVAAAPGFRLSASGTEGTSSANGIDESQLPAWRGSRLARTIGATWQLRSSRPLEIPLSPIPPDVNTTVRQTLTVRPAIVDWTAELDLTVRDAPVGLYRLQIDPRVNVRQARITQEAVERLASWSRTAPDQLMLFLKEELSGSQQVQLTGTLQVEDRRDFDIPSLSLEGATLSEPPEVVVRHTSDAAVVVAADDGTVIAPDPQATPAEGIVSLATLNLDPTLPPLRIQRAPREPTSGIEQLTVVEPLPQGDAGWRRFLHIDASQLPQETVAIEIAAPPPDIQTAVSVPLTQESGEDWTRLNLDLAASATEVIDMTISGRLPASSELPEVRVAGSLVPQQMVVIPEGAGLDLEDAVETADRKELSAWSRAKLAEQHLRPGKIYQMAGSRVSVVSGADDTADAWLRRVASAVWQLPDGRLRGVTVADITAHQETMAELAIPPGMTLRMVALDGREIPAQSSPGTFTIPEGRAPQQLVLWWADDAADTDGIRLPVPTNLEPVPSDVVLFGNESRYYLFDDSTEVMDPEELLERMTARESDEAVSPVLQALRDAGVGVTSPTGTSSRDVYAIRLEPGQQAIAVRIFDRQLADIISLILAAGLVLVVWFLVGRWSDRLSRLAGATSGLPGLIVLAALVWLQGISWLGLVLLVILCGLWLLELRRANAQRDSDFRLQSAH